MWRRIDCLTVFATALSISMGTKLDKYCCKGRPLLPLTVKTLFSNPTCTRYFNSDHFSIIKDDYIGAGVAILTWYHEPSNHFPHTKPISCLNQTDERGSHSGIFLPDPERMFIITFSTRSITPYVPENLIFFCESRCRIRTKLNLCLLMIALSAVWFATTTIDIPPKWVRTRIFGDSIYL